jgi:SAM-dependent methyltransferase
MIQQFFTDETIAKQTGQYKFPYHWLPNIGDLGVVAGRSMQWALEYCGYMSVVADKIKKTQAKDIIDIGCGDGRLGSFLGDKSRLNYLGIDISQNAIAFASIFNPLGRYSCARPSDIKEKFDVAVAIEVLEHIPDETLPQFLADIRGVLKPDGVFIVTVPTTVRKVHPKHFRHYNEKVLESQFGEAGFTIVELCRLHTNNRMARCLQIALTNRFFSLNASFMTRWIWSTYQHFCLRAGTHDGAHILAIATARC